jgi:hypothetical protein
VRTLIADVLTADGHEMTGAANGAAHLFLIEQPPEFDLILGDSLDAHTGATTTDFDSTSRRKRHALHSVRQDYREVVCVFHRGHEGSVLDLVGG